MGLPGLNRTLGCVMTKLSESAEVEAVDVPVEDVPVLVPVVPVVVLVLAALLRVIVPVQSELTV